MFKNLFLKEIQETIYTQRFFIAVLLCLLLIPTGTYVSLKDYGQRHDSYNESMRLYKERSEGNVGINFRAEGYRPPSELSFLSAGLESSIPNKIMTSNSGRFSIESESGSDMSQSELFGKIDFQFIVSYVLTLLAFIFTFASITGEKENATLRLIMSNQVPRWKVILAKILGNYMVFLAPFVIALLFMMLIITATGSFNIFSVEILLKIGAIVLISMLFLLSMFSLGILVSTMTKRSMTSMVVLLFIWVVFALVVPKLSPMTAEALYAVKSQQVLTMEKRIAGDAIYNDYKEKQIDLLDRIALDYGVEDEGELFGNIVPLESEKALEQYNEEKVPLDIEYEKRISSEMRKLDENYKNNKRTQTTWARNLSRISPISSFAYIVSEIAGTGLLERENIEQNARIFQDEVKESVYDKFEQREYHTSGGSSYFSSNSKDGIKSEEIPVPMMSSYVRKPLAEILQAEWVDIMLLLIFNVLFFAGAFVRFLRYDVR